MSEVCLHQYGPHYYLTIISFSYCWFPSVLYKEAVLNFHPATICHHNFSQMPRTLVIWHLVHRLALAYSRCYITFIKLNWNVDSVTPKQDILSFFPYIKLNHVKFLLTIFDLQKKQNNFIGFTIILQRRNCSFPLQVYPITFSFKDTLSESSSILIY